MNRLRTSTALIAGLAALTPAIVPVAALAETTADTACIAQEISAGQTEEQARKNCEEQAKAAEDTPAPASDTAQPVEGAAPVDGSPPVDAADAVDGSAPVNPAEIVPPAEGGTGAEPAPETMAPADPAPMTDPQADQAAKAAIEGTTPPAEQTPAESAASEPVVTPEASADADAKASVEGGTAPAPQPTAEAKTITPEADATGEAAAQTEVQPVPQTEAQTETQTDTQTASQAETQTQPQATENDPNETSAKFIAPEEAKVLEQAIAAQQSASEGAPVENQALAAPADAPIDETASTEETVTEETARSASEDFSTKVTATPTGEVTASDTKKKKKDRVSPLETAALAGLGALAVGALLNNGSKVAVNSGDRVVVQNPDGSYALVKDDNALLRQPGSTIRTQDFADGSSRTIVTKEDGSQIVTIYDAQRRILKRTLIQPDGTQYLLIDDARGAEPVDVTTLPKAKPVATISSSNEAALREALSRQSDTNRAFTLSQVRNIEQVRDLAPAVTVENITFETGSAAIQPDQARALSALGQAIQQRIAENPRELFLIEGHTDAVGNAAYNLALSDRRAETVALALSEYFGVPAENLVVQGYGEQYLKVPTEGPSEQNRRAVVRRITDLLRMASN
ncbi:hypothetical protein BMI90_12470 [Thioclava sp. L04-15]|uniref:OmpA family protein n=1 Tax=Thioclava sp. L04-15 TaxID=1915318 RepID=UPI0009971CFA|nr:OmpA family protein [Thioclava sp. L04-15]OOY27423.1 hypothetical protein BMI90_12470 [Thioclava sp. L04-15]TNE83442.1 MAG: OmpA family protein [Paracoccaceae bacterium]